MRIDCSKAENFIRERARMCKSFAYGCTECDLAKAIWVKNKRQYSCQDSMVRYPERAVMAVQKWSDEHPRNYKSYKDVYLERYPDATLSEGHPCECVSDRFWDGFCGEYNECWECWDLPYQGEEMKEVVEG